ncbi:MAG: heat-inducible transcriptional repressor HrcA [Synechococcales cyanobacterium CRU_2_2]|nr:heat-inducible transcriptional repressor HrcA [Synechococcales cyanobacterium CRU_2_2]
MTSFAELTQRQQQILQATIRRYIITAEPVGSKALAIDCNLQVSPATVRNAMGSLERAGLLYQPHPSAGRVPSDYGYRTYVDQLITPSEAQSRRVEQELSGRLRAVEDWSIEAVLRGAAQVLSSISGYITLVTLPRPSTARLHHVQLVQVEPGRAMLIVVTDSYHTHSGVFGIPQLSNSQLSNSQLSDSQLSDSIGSDSIGDEEARQTQRELELLSNFLNHHLRNRTLTDLSQLDWRELGQEFDRYSSKICSILLALSESYKVPHLTQILISGVSEILRQPEFNQLQQFQTLIHLLEDEQELVWPLIFADPETNNSARVMIKIGSENPLVPMQACTLISASYRKGNEAVGSVGMLGPTRMAYENSIAAVEATADYISERLR